jgi:hypothetical protein
MQPILAETAPHRGRALVLAAAFLAVTAVAAITVRPFSSHHRHRSHHHLRMGKCVAGSYVHVIVR